MSETEVGWGLSFLGGEEQQALLSSFDSAQVTVICNNWGQSSMLSFLISIATSIQLCIIFILAGLDKLDTDCGHRVADNIRNHRWIDLRKASTITWHFPSWTESHRSSDPDFVLLPGPRRSSYICSSPTLVCSGQQQDCVMPPFHLFLLSPPPEIQCNIGTLL